MTAILEELPGDVSIYEVGPRDGLQNEAVTIGTVRKLRLIEALIHAGLKRIEITSFVSPLWIPQLADADRLADLVTAAERGDVQLSALCPNGRGLARARVAGLKEIAVFLSASETHNKRNINKSIDQALNVFRDLIPQALEYGMRVRGYVSTVWGCPYEGTVPPENALRLARELVGLGCYEVSLGDTIGVGTPRQTKAIMQMLLRELPANKLAMHMHDTRGQALANVLVGLELGIRTFDAAIAGLGGCPYAPGASGNLATEDIVYMLHHMGVKTGIDPEKLFEAGRVAEAIVRRELPGRVHRAGLQALKG
ncbi:MAG TPA: hydroxymethylglutaryl-CoA lyase [Polyangiales bacterium]|nr:hydroxymethylglutaryl-CoA lyase [Polyangiales bacterium]